MPSACAAPLPRAYQWADGSAYVVHVELVRKGARRRHAAVVLDRSADLSGRLGHFPRRHGSDPDRRRSPGASISRPRSRSSPTTCRWASRREDAGRHIKLLMLANDVSLRNLIPAELAKGFGFFQSKPWTSFSPVAVTPDELGDAWNGGSIDLPLVTTLNGELFGRPNARTGMVFDFPQLIAHAAKTRPLGAGTIIGSGTVANEDRSVGSSCIVERRAIEAIERRRDADAVPEIRRSRADRDARSRRPLDLRRDRPEDQRYEPQGYRPANGWRFRGSATTTRPSARAARIPPA